MSSNITRSIYNKFNNIQLNKPENNLPIGLATDKDSSSHNMKYKIGKQWFTTRNAAKKNMDWTQEIN